MAASAPTILGRRLAYCFCYATFTFLTRMLLAGLASVPPSLLVHGGAPSVPQWITMRV